MKGKSSRIVHQYIKSSGSDALNGLRQGYHILIFGHIKIQHVNLAGLEMLTRFMWKERGDNGVSAENKFLGQGMADASVTTSKLKTVITSF